MERQNIRSGIRKVLYESDERALSAKDIAETLDFSRQYVDRQLRSMARDQGYIRRVEIGPAVGYYWDYDGLEVLESEFDQRDIDRPAGTGAMPVLCRGCDRKLTAGDEAIIIFERIGHQWDIVQTVCTDHLDDVRVDNIVQSYLPENYVSEALEDIGMGFAAVHGTLEEHSFVEESNGRELFNHALGDVTILQLIRPRELSVGPDFEE